jgi:hypothetical protein
MQATLWNILVLMFVYLVSLMVCGLAGSHVAGLRGQEQLDGFKTGLLMGPIGVAVLAFKKARVPDVDVECPHCGTRQDVDGALEWFECWTCEQKADVASSSA